MRTKSRYEDLSLGREGSRVCEVCVRCKVRRPRVEAEA